MIDKTLIENLQRSEAFNHRTMDFRVIETHASWILLTGDFCYKIKKAVNFGFLDFSTLEKRQFYCEEELRLNRLIAPDLYLAVVPITGIVTEPSIQGGGPVLEYAVKMRQFNQENLFSSLQLTDQLTVDHITQIARQLAEFHQAAARVSDTVWYGTPEQVLEPIKQNFDQIRPMLQEPTDLLTLSMVERWSIQQFEVLYSHFVQRRQQGFVRECHGDVHLGNMAYHDDKAILFDSIEFNIGFRFTDTMADLGFFLMDLQHKNLYQQAAHALDQYLTISGDYEGLAVLRFYEVYRAVVRAKINLFRTQDPQLSEADKLLAWSEHRSFMQLALTYQQQELPRLIITHGVSGSGKTTITNALLDQFRVVRLRSDVERKRLVGLSALTSSKSELKQGLYHAVQTEKTYDQLKQLAQVVLTAGYSVIVDACFLHQTQRRLFYELAERLAVSFIILHCEASSQVLSQRVLQRQIVGKDASEANLEVLSMQLLDRELFITEEAPFVLLVNTESSCTIDTVVQAIQQHHLTFAPKKESSVS